MRARSISKEFDHDVADTLDLLRGYPLGEEIGIRIPGRRPEQVADGIGHQAVDLFRHASVAASQPRLEVHDRDPELRPDERAGGGSIDVPRDHDGGRALALAHRFVGDHGASGLLGVRAAADFEGVSRLGQAQVAEEGIRHVRVVVLPGVHDAGGAPALPRQCV
jgi:hypothetical protein